VALIAYLADTSVWMRLRRPEVSAVLEPLLDRGLVGTCRAIDTEILFGARTGAEHAEMWEERKALPWLPLPDEVWDRAIAVQGLLAERGQHRAASISDLLIAATAERHGVTVLHYDADFDLIAAVTGQPTEWVVPRGGVA